MRQKLEFTVERLKGSSSYEIARMQVYKGWIIHITVSDKNKLSTSSVFVPDSDHQWSIIPSPKEEGSPKESASHDS